MKADEAKSFGMIDEVLGSNTNKDKK